MVRLKDTNQCNTRRAYLQFQFPNGSIKSGNVRVKIISFAVFQFPNGSIKRSGIEFDQLIEELFQFPNGSIKSCRIYGVPPHLIGFNSLMVRVKELSRRFLNLKT